MNPNPTLRILCGVSCAAMLFPSLQARAESEYFFREKKFPPATSYFVTPAQAGPAFANGIGIRNLRCRAPSDSVVPPLLGGNVSHSFGSQVEMEVSTDGGLNWSLAAAAGSECHPLLWLAG